MFENCLRWCFEYGRHAIWASNIPTAHHTTMTWRNGPPKALAAIATAAQEQQNSRQSMLPDWSQEWKAFLSTSQSPRIIVNDRAWTCMNHPHISIWGFPNWFVRLKSHSNGWFGATPIHPASRGVAAHTACFFGSVTGAKWCWTWGPVCWHASQSLSRVFWSVFACFCNVFLQFVAIKPFQNIFFIMCLIPFFPQTLENTANWTYIQKKDRKILQTHCFWQCFHNVFRKKRRNWHVFRHRIGPKNWFLQCFQGSGIQKPFNSLISSNPWKHRYLHCFLQFFHVPMPLANSNIYTKNPSKTLLCSVFLHFAPSKTP